MAREPSQTSTTGLEIPPQRVEHPVVDTHTTRHPLEAMWSYAQKASPVAAVVLGTTLLFCGCATKPLPGGVAPNVAIVKSWSQGQAGNCVTVASLKAAQTVFPELAGTNGVLAACSEDAAGFDIVMRDGFACRVTKDEVKVAGRESGFNVWSKDKSKNAVLLYAACAKRAQVEGNDSAGPNEMDFKKACRSLNDGEWEEEGLSRLGLAALCRSIEIGDAKKYSAVVVCNGTHAWFVTGGYGDTYGMIRELGKERWNAYSATALLTPEQAAANPKAEPVFAPLPPPSPNIPHNF